MSLSSNNKIKPVYLKAKAASRKLSILAACGLSFLVFAGMASAPSPKVFIRKQDNGHFQLMAGNRPYIVKGVCYNPVPVGSGPTYDWWSDPAKPWLVDGALMKEMGVNTVRLYQSHEHPEEVRRVVRDLYEKFGIRTMMGDWVGFWEHPYPAYGDPLFRERIKAEVLNMVKLYKDEPGILFWVLGNENNYSCTARVRPWTNDEVEKEPDPQKQNALRYKIYYSFINEIAKEIHKIDPDHPVALGNGELIGLEFAKEYCPEADLIACIIYRGNTFGNLFNSLKSTFDRPIVIAEFGADVYDAYLKKEDPDMQAFFLESQWRQIYKNLAGVESGAGNCLGGTLFEWADEWWKHNEGDPETWKAHDTESSWSNGSYYFDIEAEGNKNMNEEWFGIVALSLDIENGLNKRIPRKAYYTIMEFWKNPTLKIPRKQRSKSPKS